MPGFEKDTVDDSTEVEDFSLTLVVRGMLEALDADSVVDVVEDETNDLIVVQGTVISTVL